MHPQGSEISIRDIETIAEMREVEALQKEVWGLADREIFPALAFIPMCEVGAVLLGAFDGPHLAGFVFGFPGHEKGRLILHSDMLAVLPRYRSQGLGYELKLAQRERALAEGIDTITWTFDPLQSLNAHLNFGKLGVTADRYCVNYYGETTSFLHSNGTDRLWVTWRLNSDRVRARVERREAFEQPEREMFAPLLSLGRDSDPVPAPGTPHQSLITIEIPGSINSLGQKNAALALRWREATRRAFTLALQAGYVVKEFQPADGNDRPRGVYLLRNRL
jgi:predicted GNAT superfamily acetyltransferase